MTGKTHVYCGMAVMVYLTATHPQTISIMGEDYITAIGLVTAASGSLMPDIDIERSKMGQKFHFLSKHLTHRGITHTLLIPALLTAAMHYIKQQGIPVVPEIILGFLVGWVVHILADLFNKKGVPLLWPIVSQKIHVASFKTGTWQEVVFAILFTGGLLACLMIL